MAKKRRKQKVDKTFKIATKDVKTLSKDFMKTARSGKGNLGKSFFSI